ncbi:hypothetical protein [Lentzea flava]|uniref:DUF304 domain-containing protein n=1 Tax=Lentzea flava TaxID=103732 RepID=A0ABQ2UH25_9PSEU|nr:hypothetical protein [Lentzea flava]MCP2201011.1 hypothetical protein [Lentzea flava]GGU27630.1 hypothetical protein GCM10010178_19800 [Lentzea flava]
MQTDTGIDLFRKPPEITDPPPSLDHGKPPRGLTKAGWIRTTGWLQVGDHPVHSAHVATVVGLLWSLVVAAVLVTAFPVVAGVLVLTVPVLCGGFWWLFTTFLRPSSLARNVGTKQADSLSPGDLVRLYGSIGPIAQVTEVALGSDVRVTFHGGSHRSWARDQVVHLAELLS